MANSSKISYKTSGVNIDEANRFIRVIKPSLSRTRRSEVLGDIGGFGALFRLNRRNYKKPILVSTTDGVGTKLICAKATGRYEMLGRDLVAMNVNDIITCGAEPLFFLDYFAVGKVKVGFMQKVMKGMAKACSESGCSLVGGETAEMPGLYRNGDFDLAGFAVGVIEEARIIDGRHVKTGDVIIGCASNGIHANGFSMVRKVFSPGFIRTHAHEILKPTQLYVKPVLRLTKRVGVKAMAHITGGGFYDNIPRVLPKDKCAVIHSNSWTVPEVFRWIRDKGKTDYREMHRTFNMGIGYIVVVSAAESRKTLRCLAKDGIRAWVIGEIKNGQGVRIQ